MNKSIRLVLVSVILTLTFLGHARPAEASHFVHVVQPGETLFSIGLQYGLPVTTLKAANGLAGDMIYVGQPLVIPGFGAPVAAPVADPPAWLRTGDGMHIVQPGENLAWIGLKYAVTMDTLIAANGLFGPTIYVGQQLIIPGTTAPAPPAPTPAPVSSPIPAAAPTSNSAAAPETALSRNPKTGLQGKHFVVDLSEQRIYAYDGRRLLMTTLVSTGLPKTPTVTGLYSIYLKYESQRLIGPDYDLPDVPYVMYFYEGYSIHGTYWHDDFGQPRSRGCVNLPTSKAKWAYDWASLGTPVLVQP